MAELTFWCSFAVVWYVYIGYPLLLLSWRRLASRRVGKGPYLPSVTVVIAAHNEALVIGRKLINCLELHYPRDLLQIVVSVDGSSDRTEEIARSYEARGVEVVSSPAHRGKAAALNRAVSIARNEILVFTDARQAIDRNAIRNLAANFRDASVGAVSGELILSGEDAGGDGVDAVGFYWRYEKWLRAMESDIHSTVGASGALYAIRRKLFRPLPDGMILDDVVIPMRTVLDGYRTVFEPRARAYDGTLRPEAEFGRKVRTLLGNYQLLERMPALLHPSSNPVFLQFVSHKVGRLVVPYFLVALFVSNLFLTQGIYAFTLLGQVCWYLLACVGAFAGGPQGRAAPFRPLRSTGR